MNAVNRKQALLFGASLAAALLIAGLPGSAVAEDASTSPLAPLEPLVPFFDDGSIVGGYPFKASTPAESFARGAADVTRARGEYNLLSSQAAINLQDARSRAIINNQDAVDAYFRIRQMNRDYRAAMRGPRPTQEDFERYARAARPAPLSPSELNTLTGRVRWPVLLRHDRFAELRAELESLLDRWAVSRNLGQLESFGAQEHLAVRRLTDQMQDILKAEVRNLPPQDYSSTQRFLQSLKYQVLASPSSTVSLADFR